jgi:hypothetical protein
LLGLLADAVTIIFNWLTTTQCATVAVEELPDDLVIASPRKLRREYESALDWVNTPGTGLNRRPPRIFFDDVCDVLGVHPDRLRATLQEQMRNGVPNTTLSQMLRLTQKAVASEHMNRLNDNPAFVAKHLITSRDTMNRLNDKPAFVEKHSITSRETMTRLHAEDQQFKVKSAAAGRRNMTQNWQNSEFVAANSERTKRRWVEYRMRKAQQLNPDAASAVQLSARAPSVIEPAVKTPHKYKLALPSPVLLSPSR